MAVDTKSINRRIKSVGNTKKITRAMELVSAAKMRKAVASTLASRAYANLAWALVRELTKNLPEGTEHKLLKKKNAVGKKLAIIISSDRGLCGAFNNQLLKKFVAFWKESGSKNIEAVCIGKRGQQLLRRLGVEIKAVFPELAIGPNTKNIRPLRKFIVEGFTNGTYDSVSIFYTDYKSAVAQYPRQKQLLPLEQDEELGSVDNQNEEPTSYKLQATSSEYLFEPGPMVVLNSLLPRIVESQIYQALLESQASEHSARMVAMRSATDAAGEMLEDLHFTFNQARQASITREIAEISAGRAALE